VLKYLAKLIGSGRLIFYDNKTRENAQIYFKEYSDMMLNNSLNKVKCHRLNNESSVCGRNGNFVFAALTGSWAYQVGFKQPESQDEYLTCSSEKAKECRVCKSVHHHIFK
jgi:hypothetical protein